MRIRKRSIAALSSSSYVKAAMTSTCKAEEAAAAAATEKEFFLPLVAAVMDLEAKAEADLLGGGDVTIISTAANGIAENHTRPVHTWRSSLQRCNPYSEALQVGGEGDKSDIGWNGIVRRNGEDKFGLLISEGRTEEKKQLMWRERRQDLDVGTVMKKRRKQLDCTTKCLVRRHINADRSEDAIAINRKDTIQMNKTKTKYKARDNDNDKINSLRSGSQCRRRNGRGWRCSEKSAVGYFLCEHHLGKGRLMKSIKGAAPVEVKYNKGTKFKELHLIHAALPC